MIGSWLHGHRQPILQEQRRSQRHAARLAGGLGKQEHHPIARSLVVCKAAHINVCGTRDASICTHDPDGAGLRQQVRRMRTLPAVLHLLE